MVKLLPIGSIVRLHHGTLDIMIIGRYPLYDKKGTIGYFEYVACLYPLGTVDEKLYYFNHENIDQIVFEGYTNEKEEELQTLFQSKVDEIKYPRFTV